MSCGVGGLQPRDTGQPINLGATDIENDNIGCLTADSDQRIDRI